MTVNIAGDQEGTIVEGSGNEEGINPLWWPGDGPAPQVTSISLYKYGWLTNGNFGVTIKVYGYGSDTTTFDGRSIFVDTSGAIYYIWYRRRWLLLYI